ncbi:MAG TPA: hypothetical protein VF909_21075 [Roseiflexaceae bacterium]
MVVSQRPFFAPRLSFKITLPYVVLALILALATIYVVARTQAAKVTTEFARQIDDARVRVGDSVVRTEQAQVADVRTLSRLIGLPGAVRAGDSKRLLNLVAPYAVSQSIERIVVVDAAGHAGHDPQPRRRYERRREQLRSCRLAGRRRGAAARQRRPGR